MASSDSQPTPAPASPANSRAHQVVRTGMLNPQLDLARLAGEFAAEGVLQIHQALRSEVAELLYDCVSTQVPWSLAYRDQSGPRKLWSEELAALDTNGREALDEMIYGIARQQFQFRYDSFMMVTAYKEKRNPELVLHRVIEQINSPEWIEAFRRITGFSQIRRADAQATRYVAGHFLRRHNDLNEDDGRLCAYVINLSREWQADWGGLLQILDANGQVTRTLMPSFNSISLFRVPTEHCVSPVAPFANGARYAITGWFRT
ncbi:MAG TPA: 2OG-Fe(II) oxygenase family protein [Xanthomonadales bacterium]|nr:2OG-Fe(II) oxygenase family protein [Xanthomonadales bacterium]